jgi:hypothetical protein
MTELRLDFPDEKIFEKLKEMKEDEKEQGYVDSWEEFILLSVGLTRRKKKDGR